MAVNESSSEKPAAPAPAAKPVAKAAASPASAPSWLLSLYLGGLVLVYVGERVLSGLEKGAGFVTALGVIGVVVSTLLRFAPRFRSGGERVAIERLLAALSATGVVALVFYGLTTDRGMDLVGIANMAEPGRTKVLDLLTVAWIAMIAISTLPLIFAETALRPMRSAERPESRRVRAAAEAGLTLGVSAVYLTLLVYAASGVDLDVDFSYFKTSRASESTKKIAASVSDPVRVVAFFPQVNEVKNEVQRYLDDLRPSAPKLRIEMLDRLAVPKTARDLRVTQDGVIVLSKGGVTHSITLGTELDQAKAKLKTLDRDFQEQLTKLAHERRTVYVTVGHGELNETSRGPSGTMTRSGSIAKQLLQRQNLVVRDLGLAQGLASAIPDDAEAVLVLGPTEPFSDQEIATLRRYAEGGGKLLLALDADAFSTRDALTNEGDRAPAEATSAKPAAPAAPSAKPAASAAPAASGAPALREKPPVPATASGPLDELARTVGLAYSSEVLANERQFVRLRSDDSDKTRMIVSSFSSHASVSTLSRNAPRAAVIVFGSGSLERAPGATERADFAIKSASGTFADTNRNFRFDKDSERQAVFNVGAAVTKQLGDAKDDKPDEKKDEKKDAKAKKEAKKELRAFVLADADALSDFVMAEVIANQVLFLDAVRWLIGEESVAGLPNTEEDKKIQHTKQEDLAWFYSSIFGAPALVMGVGVWISRRSRAKGGRR
ncbi:MAG TPA: Gldg family protein [Polyangiaceae bacterium]